MDIRLNDVLEMKKTHPCGEKRWQVLRTGMDFRLRCLGSEMCIRDRDVGQPRPVRLENLEPPVEWGFLFAHGTGS